MKVVLTTFNSKYIHSSLALHSLKSYCEQDKVTIKIIEHTIQTPILSALANIIDEKPAVVGIAVHIWNKNQSFQLANLIKKVAPETKVIIGGPEISYDLQEVFARVEEVDYAIQGEGEQALHQLITNLKNLKDGKGIQGIAYKENQTIHNQEQIQIIKDLDSLPFAYNLTDKDCQNKILYYETSRGCPYACTYCLSGIHKNLRFKSLDKVFVELQQFIDAGIRQVKFVDRTYNINDKHYKPIFRWLIDKKPKTNFHFEIKADKIDEQTLDILKLAPKGLFQFEIGIQSTNKQTLKCIKREHDWEKTVDIVTSLKKFGNIHLHLDLICGLPYETLEQFKQSFNEVYKLSPHALQIGFLKLLKGTLITEDAEKYGYKYMNEPPYEVLENNYITYTELSYLKVFEQVFDQTYNSGKFVHTLQYLLQHIYVDNPYSLFSCLADWWRQNNQHNLMHNNQTTANNLQRFIKEQHQNHYENLMDCLKLDIITTHNNNFMPDYISWYTMINPQQITQIYKEEIAQHIPDFAITTWRQTKNNYKIESFDNYYSGQKTTPILVLFDIKTGLQKIIKNF